MKSRYPHINRIEVLSNRLIPGSDRGVEHVVVANHAIVIIRSTDAKGRVRISKDTIHVGPSNLAIMLAGLDARVDTARHFVGGEALVFGAVFLAKQPDEVVKHFGSVQIGSPAGIIHNIAEAHCRAEISSNLRAIAYELNGIFLPVGTFDPAGAVS